MGGTRYEFLMRSPRLLPAAILLIASPVASATWFEDVTDVTGPAFAQESGAEGALRMPEIMGPGCALFDADGDGDLDAFLTNGAFAARPTADRPASDRPAGDRPVNRLFLNEGGAFTDATDGSGLADDRYGMGVAAGDWDGDGLVDLYVTNVGPDCLYRNLGGGRFEDVTAAAGIVAHGWSCSAAFADLDGDGDLDLFVTRYVAWDPAKTCTDPAGRPEYCGPLEFPPLHDLLFLNRGDGTFVDHSAAAGIAGVAAAGLGLCVADFDGDGRPDVYVANDAYANHLWINRGDAVFEDDALLLGAAFNVQGMAEAGMGVVAADFDDDLDLDLFMTHLRNESNTLYVFEGAEIGFEDRTGTLGLATPSLRTTGFGTVAIDVELDGDLDVVVVNGAVNRGEPWDGEQVGPPWNRFAEPNQVYRRDPGGFVAAPEEAGPLGRVEVSRGLACGDVDGDGDLDLLVANAQGPARLYRNIAPAGGAWLAVRPVDAAGGPVVPGSEVVVVAGGVSRLRRAVAAFSYLSSSDPTAHFGLGPATVADRIEVRWPDGSREMFPGTGLSRIVECVRGTGTAAP
jgi:hypothetical protein